MRFPANPSSPLHGYFPGPHGLPAKSGSGDEVMLRWTKAAVRTDQLIIGTKQ